MKLPIVLSCLAISGVLGVVALTWPHPQLADEVPAVHLTQLTNSLVTLSGSASVAALEAAGEISEAVHVADQVTKGPRRACTSMQNVERKEDSVSGIYTQVMFLA